MANKAKSVSAETAGKARHLYSAASNCGCMRPAVARKRRRGRTRRMWNVHVDLQRRNRCTAVDPHPHVFPFNRDLPGDRCENLLLQNSEEIGLPARGAFVRQQDLEPLSRLRRGPLAAEEREKFHAAL